MKNSERNPMHLFEIFNPGQYFEIDIYSNGIGVWCMLMRSRGQTKSGYPGPYYTYIPFDQPYVLYKLFTKLKLEKLLKLEMIYKEIEI